MTLTADEFERLLAEIKVRLHAACIKQNKTAPDKDMALFGMQGQDAPGELSIHTFLLANDRVQKYLEKINEGKEENKKKIPSPQRLYTLHLQVKSGAQDIELNRIYKDIYFLLCDCENKEEFFRKHPSEKQEVLFNVLYFSERDKKVNTFELTLNLTQDNRLDVAVKDAHDNFHEQLKGSAELIGDCWKLPTRIIGPQRTYYMELAIPVGGTRLNDPTNLITSDFIQALAYGISSSGHPLSFECILVNTGSQLKERNTLLAKRYLNVRRLHFHSEIENDKLMESMDHIRTHGVFLSTVERLPGTYRILSYWKGQFIRSKFFIFPDLTAASVRPKKGKRECRLSLQSHHGTSLLIQTLDITRENVSTLTVIKDIDRPLDIRSGVFCTTGSLKNGPFVMTKESDVTPDKMDREKWDNRLWDEIVIEEDELFKKLKLALQELSPNDAPPVPAAP